MTRKSDSKRTTVRATATPWGGSTGRLTRHVFGTVKRSPDATTNVWSCHIPILLDVEKSSEGEGWGISWSHMLPEGCTRYRLHNIVVELTFPRDVGPYFVGMTSRLHSLDSHSNTEVPRYLDRYYGCERKVVNRGTLISKSITIGRTEWVKPLRIADYKLNSKFYESQAKEFSDVAVVFGWMGNVSIKEGEFLVSLSGDLECEVDDSY
jgi:hypothetical protein